MTNVVADGAWLAAVLADVQTSSDSPEVHMLRSMLEASAEVFAHLRSDVESAPLSNHDGVFEPMKRDPFCGP